MRDADPSEMKRRTLLDRLYDYLATPEWERPVVGFLILLLAPAGLAALAVGPRFRGLDSLTALDHAQLARSIFDGHGFATSVIRPLSLLFRADLKLHPDLYNAPAHPILLGLWYCVLHPSDRMTAAFGAGVWILSVWLTFWVARRWFGKQTAALAAFLYACNSAALLAAVGGMPHPLAALGVLAAVWLVAPMPEPPDERRDSEEEEVQTPPAYLPAPRLWGAGAACAFAVLTHYLLAALPLSLAAYLAVSQKRPTRALRLFAIGFAVPLLPWMLRSLLLTGSPFFSLYWYEALANTRTYPGESIWRVLGAGPPGLFSFVFSHPLEMARKGAAGIIQFREQALNTTDPVVGFLFLAALLGARGGWKWRRLVGSVAGGMLLFAAASCVFRPEPSLLLAWAPLLAILAAGHCTAWLTENVGRITLGRFRIRRAWVLFGARAAILVSAAFPLVFFMAVGLPWSNPMHEERLLPLRRLLPENARVITDQPVLVAWYGKRQAVWLCQEESGFEALERTLGPMDAAYVTSGLARMRPEEKAAWWMWLASPAGVYRGLAPSGIPLPDAVLRIRRK